MKRLILAATMAVSTLSGCTTAQTTRACAIGEVAGKTLAQLLADLRAAGVDGPLAEKLALGLFLGQTARADVCAVIASPVVVPGG